jgi:membrane protease YdiL (CAAX protease family)
MTHLLFVLAIACLAPLVVVVPVHFWGRARERAGKPPGWDGPAWSLLHVWLAFAWMIAAQVLTVWLIAPGVIERIVSGGTPPAIDFPGGGMNGDQVLWTMVAVSSSLLVILPGAPLRLLWTTRWSPAHALLAAWIAFLVLRLLMVVLVPSLPDIMSDEHPQRELTDSLSRLTAERSFAVTALVVGIAAPVVEELLFRGVMLTALARRIPFPWANAIQAALFATLHLTTPIWPFFFVMGLIAGWMVRRSGGLLPAIVLHVLNNGSALALLWYFSRSG